MPSQSFADGARYMADIALKAAPKAKKLPALLNDALEGLPDTLEQEPNNGMVILVVVLASMKQDYTERLVQLEQRIQMLEQAGPVIGWLGSVQRKVKAFLDA